MCIFSLASHRLRFRFFEYYKSKQRKWINERGFVKGKFQWQSGYGAFSHSRSQRDEVIKYIMTQEENHKIKTIKEEYLKMLNDFEVNYEEKYLFQFYDHSI